MKKNIKQATINGTTVIFMIHHDISTGGTAGFVQKIKTYKSVKNAELAAAKWMK